jgi:hypothetical protein
MIALKAAFKNPEWILDVNQIPSEFAADQAEMAVESFDKSVQSGRLSKSTKQWEEAGESDKCHDEECICK